MIESATAARVLTTMRLIWDRHRKKAATAYFDTPVGKVLDEFWDEVRELYPHAADIAEKEARLLPHERGRA